MIDFAGSFTGRVQVLSLLALQDVPNHELQTAEVAGPQSSTDEKWNGARVTYWGVTDLVAGHGTQRGYFLNERADGSRDWGTFEGRATTSNGRTLIEGTWQSQGGNGRLAGLQASGTYTTTLTSPTEVECRWQGRYELAVSAQAA